jgi:enterochelin esterase-like enzyme
MPDRTGSLNTRSRRRGKREDHRSTATLPKTEPKPILLAIALCAGALLKHASGRCGRGPIAAHHTSVACRDVRHPRAKVAGVRARRGGDLSTRRSPGHRSHVERRLARAARPSTALTKGADCIWQLTLPALKPELRIYTFSVDGVTMLEPGNADVLRDGRRFLNGLMIPGEGSALYQVGDAPHRTVHQVWYASPTLGMPRRRVFVYTPNGYEQGSKHYPVLYLLHCGGDDEEAWNTLGRANEILNNFSAALPLLPGALRTVPIPPEPHRLRGPGQGQELNLAAINKDFPELSAASDARLHLLYLSCGLYDGLITAHQQFMDWLTTKGVKYQKLFLPGYAHEWSFWRISLVDLAPRLFKPGAE